MLSGNFFSQYKKPIIYFATFAVIGVVAILISSASSNEVVSLNIEQANLANEATIIDDNTALNSKAISLPSAGNVPSGWPSQNDFKVCGNSSILDGPTTAPSGAVTINPGTDLASATSSNPAGTTFYLTAGTHTLPNGPIRPRAGNTYVGAPGAVLDGQYNTNYTSGTRTMSTAFTGGTPNGGYENVTIKHLTITRFGQADGKMGSMVNQTAINWGQANNWDISNNTISYNGGNGIYVSNGSRVTNNCIEYNEQMGIATSTWGYDFRQRLNILIENNEIHNNNRSNDIENATYKGDKVCGGCSGGLKVWNTKNTIIRNNNVHSNNGSGIWVDNNNIDVLVEGNVAKDNKKRGIFYEISYSGIIQKNYVTGNYKNSKGSSNNNTAIYISESGGDEAAKNYLGGSFPAEVNISNNYIVDNWNGISLWEDAGRYCTRPRANDTNWCPPLIQGEMQNMTTSQQDSYITNRCTNNLVANADICRWRTQNVNVHDNVFEMTESASSFCSPTSTGCSKVGIWANTGPSGTPYSGNTIREDITKNNNNQFDNNTYIGNTNYFAYDGNVVSKSDWQNTWNQDKNSQFISSVDSPCQVLSSNPSTATFNNVDLGGGDYKLWARVKNSSTAGKLKIVIDDNKCADITPDQQSNDYQWISTDQIIDSIGSGAHDIKILALDDNIKFDSVLVIDQSTPCDPTGDGSNCTGGTPPPPPTISCPDYDFKSQTDSVGMSEASGLIESRNQPGVFWSHNDSGGTNEIFAIDSNGKILSRHSLGSVSANDWEDISFGPGPDPNKDYIYVGDVGTRNRSSYKIYRVAEPTVNMSWSNSSQSIAASQVETLPITYKLKDESSRQPDVEAFSVDPLNGDIYLIDKGINNRSIPGYNGTSYVYKINGSSLSTGGNVATEVANPIMNVASDYSSGDPVGPIGSDISTDGNMLIVKNYEEIFIWFKDGAANFDTALSGANNGLASCIYNSSDIDGATIPLAESISISPDNSFISMLSEGSSSRIITYEDSGGVVNPPNDPPSKPTNVRVDSVGDGQVTISWDANTEPDFQDYKVRYKPVGDPDTSYATSVDSLNTTTHTVTGLTNNVEYSIEVRARDNSDQKSSYSPVTATPVVDDNQAPARPKNVQIDSVGDGQVTISWDASPEPDWQYYKVRYKPADAPDTSYATGGDNLTSTSFTVSGLTNGTEYSIEVRASDVSGNKSNYSPVLATPTQSSTNPSDINQDGTVGIVDLSILLNNWDPQGTGHDDARADIDNDNNVGIIDLSIMLNNWGK